MKKIVKVSILTFAVMVLIASGVLLDQVLRETPARAETKQISVLPNPGQSFADVAELIDPAVVSITVVKVLDKEVSHGHQMFDPFHFFFGPEDRQEMNPQKPVQQSGGSGFIISEDGEILTNNHVVDEADKVTVTLADGREFTAHVTGRDPESDIALIKIDSNGLPRVNLGNSDAIRPGDWVVAIGNPLMYAHTVTVGVISAKERRLPGSRSSLDNYLQTDAAINFGNSGGPLVNARGEVIGINTAIMRGQEFMGGGGMVEGIGFAIPINNVKNILPQLRKGKVERGFLGVHVGAIDEDAKQYYKQKFNIDLKEGAIIQGVDPNTPAASAGVVKGDVLIKINGKPLKDANALVQEIASMPPGEEISLTIQRNGREKIISTKLASRTDYLEDSGMPRRRLKREAATEGGIGIAVDDITSENRWRYRIPDAIKGVVIVSVEPRSKAFSKGLAQGMVIQEINGKPIRNVEDFDNAISKTKRGESISLYVIIGGEGEGAYFYLKTD